MGQTNVPRWRMSPSNNLNHLHQASPLQLHHKSVNPPNKRNLRPHLRFNLHLIKCRGDMTSHIAPSNNHFVPPWRQWMCGYWLGPTDRHRRAVPWLPLPLMTPSSTIRLVLRSLRLPIIISALHHWMLATPVYLFTARQCLLRRDRLSAATL